MKKMLSCILLTLCALPVLAGAPQAGGKAAKRLVLKQLTKEGVSAPNASYGTYYLPGTVAQRNALRYAPDAAAEETGAALTKAVLDAQKTALHDMARNRVYNKQLVEQHIKAALVEVFINGVTGTTGFIFEAKEKGKTKLWIAFSYHGVGGKGAPVNVRFTLLDGTQQKEQVQVAVAGRGMRNGADMALAELPSFYTDKVFALRWSPVLPKAGDVVDSHGFSMYPFRMYEKTAERLIKAVSGFKIITTNKFVVSGLGACGSPLLDDNGYVVGLHQSSFQQESFAVNRLVVEDLLQAFYGGKAFRPLLVYGKKIGEIELSEQIGAVMIRRNGQLIMEYLLQQHTGEFAYDKMEDLPHTRYGDEVRILISDIQGNARFITYMVQ